jgi:hypothetical protein
MISIMWQLDDDEPIVPPHPGAFIKFHLYWHERSAFWLAKETGLNYTKLARMVSNIPNPVTGRVDRLSPYDCVILSQWSGVPAYNWAFLQTLYDLWEAQHNPRKDGRRRYERREDINGNALNGNAHLLSGELTEDTEIATGS